AIAALGRKFPNLDTFATSSGDGGLLRTLRTVCGGKITVDVPPTFHACKGILLLALPPLDAHLCDHWLGFDQFVGSQLVRSSLVGRRVSISFAASLHLCAS